MKSTVIAATVAAALVALSGCMDPEDLDSSTEAEAVVATETPEPEPEPEPEPAETMSKQETNRLAFKLYLEQFEQFEGAEQRAVNKAGKAICQDLRNGYDLVDVAMDLVTSVEGLAFDDAGRIIGAAAQAFCPRQLDHIN